MTLTLVRKILPASFKRMIHEIVRSLKAPKMIWGYKNSAGEFCKRTRISDTAFINRPENILISDNVFVWHYTILDGTGGLEIGEGSQIGAWVGIFTHSTHIAIRLYGRHYHEVAESEKKGYRIAPVKIGKYVFVGAGAKILPGVSIGDGALISSGAIVSKNVKEFQIVSGNPAEVVGDCRKLDKRYLKDPQLLEWYNEWQEN